jgi:hypothetical protein
MSQGNPTLEQLLDAAAEDYFSQFAAPLPARVESYNAAQQVLDAQPVIQLYVGDELVSSPIVRSIPVLFPGGGGGQYSITWPIQTGDFVGLVPGGADWSTWWASGTIGAPPPTRDRFTMAQSMAIPEIRSRINPRTAAQYSAAGLVIGAPLVYLGSSAATSFATRDDLLQTALSTLQATFDGHNHPTAPTGPVSPPSVLLSEGWPGSTAAAKVKLE